MTERGLPDPTQQSRWRPLRLLQASMDADIARLYAEARIDGLKPSYVMELLRLHAQGPMTITELARSVQRTHSATSQKVAAMRAAGQRRVPPYLDRTCARNAVIVPGRGGRGGWLLMSPEYVGDRRSRSTSASVRSPEAA